MTVALRSKDLDFANTSRRRSRLPPPALAA